MYMNLKPNKHKRISFNTTTVASLGFIGPPLNSAPPPIFIFLLRSPAPNYFGLKSLGPTLILGAGGGAATMLGQYLTLTSGVISWVEEEHEIMSDEAFFKTFTSEKHPVFKN